ncbi:MAG: hypothetical protein K0A98_12665 [Trueperaceae bacterium]|nr:hypothetical protein [Trueperaceae bacterium]
MTTGFRGLGGSSVGWPDYGSEAAGEDLVALLEDVGGGRSVVGADAVALGVDALTALLIWSMQKGSMNIRALFLHDPSDAVASVAVIVGGALIVLNDLRFVHPVIAIAGYVLWLAFREIGGPIRVLMLAAPLGIDGEVVITERVPTGLPSRKMIFRLA